MKFVRGEGSVHGKIDEADLKKNILREFIFENNLKQDVTYEFAITHKFIMYPGVRDVRGNRDSGSFLVNDITLPNADGTTRNIDLQIIESVIFAIAFDFISLLQSGKINWSGRLMITNELESFREKLGSICIDSILMQEPKMRELISKHPLP